MADVIVVGAGICGLQLAALLSHDGRQVLVLEKSAHVGGRALLWKKDGFTVDNGIHLIRFGPKSATAQVFRHLGQPLDFVDLGKSWVVFPDGRMFDFPTSPKGFLTTRLLTPGERLKTLGIMLRLRSVDPSAFYETSVAEWMDQMGFSEGVRRYLHLVTASMQVCPFLDRASAGELMENMKAVIVKRRSAMYPRQGWSYIYDCLLMEIHKRGEVRTNSKVSRIVVKNNKAQGVELSDGTQLSCQEVVINLPCQELFQVLDENLVPPQFVELCRNLKPTAGIVLDYGLSRPVSRESGLWYLWEPMSFGLFTSNLCPSVVPPGKQLLTWFQPAELSDMADLGRAREMEQRLEAALFRIFPGLEAAVEWRRAMCLQMVDGAEINIFQHRLRRPGCRVPGIEGLFLVGDSLQAPGAGGDVGHESVLVCYREMTARTS